MPVFGYKIYIKITYYFISNKNVTEGVYLVRLIRMRSRAISLGMESCPVLF